MKITIRYFNMVELALAMAVLAIGISSILVLFPVGINASTNARANDQVPMIADVALETIKRTAYNVTDWENLLKNSIPEAKPSISNINGATKGSEVLGNLYAGGSSGVYFFENDDFKATVCVWRDTDYSDFEVGSVSAGSSALKKIAGLFFVEISWPTDMPYADRVTAGNVRTYRLELFNPQVK